MIFCDTSCLRKHHLDEPGGGAARHLINRQTGVSPLSPARPEFLAALHRKLCGGLIAARTHRALVGQLADDHRDGLWSWLAVNDDLPGRAARRFALLPVNVFPRASDALRLACAREHGFREIYSNDKHLLAAAGHSGIKGRNVIK